MRQNSKHIEMQTIKEMKANEIKEKLFPRNAIKDTIKITLNEILRKIKIKIKIQYQMKKIYERTIWAMNCIWTDLSMYGREPVG